MKLDILAIGAHPDDVELSCAGTLAKEIDRGKKVGILDLTRGELGTRGSAEIRDQEAAEASKILGIHLRHNLGFRDGFFQNDEAHQLEIIKFIRKHKPQIVLTNAIKDRHIDHAKAGELTAAACFLSGLKKIETQLDGVAQKAWRPQLVLHYIQWQDLDPDIVVDISGYMSVKMEAVRAYRSQFFDEKSKEPETPISTNNFLQSVEYRARNLGRQIFKEHAEGFNIDRYPGVDSIFDLI